jgi:peptidyl-prolyl cis-trans isomerase A (cyclophilin A)
MKRILTATFCASSLMLSACGGGSDVPTPVIVAPAADKQAPTLSGATVGAPTAGAITLTASATDNTQVTGYCFKASSVTPAATDACFQVASTQKVALAVPNVSYSVWAKDAAGNVSSALTVRGPCSAAGYAASDASSKPAVCVLTTLGEFVVELESSKAPTTSANFLKYVNDGFYANTVFHRVISKFMVQGGGFTGDMAQKTPTYAAIALEAPATTGLSNTKGTIAMARTNVLNSATSQFFINVVDNYFLDSSSGGYAAFGRVISGMDTTVEAISAVSVKSNGSELSLPNTLPLIQWMYQLK